MTILSPYLNFAGNTEEAFNFYKSVFGGDFFRVVRFKDGPGGDKQSPDIQQKIMHISLPIGNGVLLMATDMIESLGQVLKTGNNFSLSLSPDSEEEALRLFNGLAEGGTIEAPFKKEFWGGFFGMILDKFGVRWMVNYEPKQ